MRWFACLGALTGLAVSAPAVADDYVALSDLIIYYQPQRTSYRPDRSDMDERDTGQAFVIVCEIARSGHLTDCEPEGDAMVDPGFVRQALRNMEDWVVADHTRSGQPTAGKLVRITVQFNRAT